MSDICKYDTDNDGNCPVHPQGCLKALAEDVTLKVISLEPNLYCHGVPVDWERAHAVKLHVSNENKLKLDAIPRGEAHIKEYIIAFDKITRKYWAVRHFPCFIDSFDCCCAAQAMQVNGPDAKVEWEDIVFPEEEETCDYCGHEL